MSRDLGDCKDIELIDTVVGDCPVTVGIVAMDRHREIYDGFTVDRRDEIDALPLEKRRAERTMTYHLIDCMIGKGAKLCHDVNGAPYIEGSEKKISISHCRGYVAVAVSGSVPIGIDIERYSDKLTRVVDRFLSPREIALFDGNESLLRAWTVKESAYKVAATPGLPLAEIGIYKGEESGEDDGFESLEVDIRCRRHHVRSYRVADAILTIVI